MHVNKQPKHNDGGESSQEQDVRQSAIMLDLKGRVYDGDILPSNSTLCLVSIDAQKARIDGVFNDAFAPAADLEVGSLEEHAHGVRGSLAFDLATAIPASHSAYDMCGGETAGTFSELLLAQLGCGHDLEEVRLHFVRCHHRIAWSELPMCAFFSQVQHGEFGAHFFDDTDGDSNVPSADEVQGPLKEKRGGKSPAGKPAARAKKTHASGGGGKRKQAASTAEGRAAKKQKEKMNA
eukprot:5098675-Pleurochrysis_carterae.AAC.1